MTMQNGPHSWIFAVRWYDSASREPLSVAEQIAAAIGDRIIADTYQPGERVIEQEVADEFQVSRGPVRDAFRILEREGLAKIHRNRGLQVTRLSAQEVRDIFEIRAALYRIVAQRLAASPPSSILPQFDALFAELEACLQDEDGGRYAETVFRLSLLSARGAGNPRLAEMIAALSLQTLRYSKLGLRSRQRRRESLALWKSTRNAIAAGDAALAMDLAVERIQRSRDEALRCLEVEATALRESAQHG
jgi:DNA-binding GntR family transcriptional regulator